MKISTSSIILQAIGETLDVAKRLESEGRSVYDIDPEALQRRVIRDQEERLAQGTDSNLYWISAFIECDGDCSDATEFEQIVALIRQGFTSGLDSLENGQYQFQIESH